MTLKVDERLVSVLLPLFIQNHIIHLQIIAILLNAGIGGFNVLYGYLFVNLHEDNFGSKWAHSCIVIWYGGLGLYVTGQSTLVSRLIYLEYKKKRTVNHDTLNAIYKKVLYGILSLIILLILALLLLLCAMQIEKSAANFEFGHKLGIYLGGIDNCIQHCMLFVYQTIYPNTTKLCLSNVKKTTPKQNETLKM
ncbi:hypothetical protein BC833DRAFT_623681 [Globomyces pollinis-pini]|nr:hypothetical protein BC833DRAFT_623681 [Globomyces pollinis-pini]